MGEGIREVYERLVHRCLAEARRVYGERLVTFAVFGSVGRGVPGPQSDIDLLIVAEDFPPGRLRRLETFEPVEQAVEADLRAARAERIHASLSPVLLTPQEAIRGIPLFLDMTEDARILYDRAGFFANLLSELRQRLRELGARRIPYGGAWYWRLKEPFHPGEEFTL
jgi:predicted nucleotidyltransferase